MLSSVYLSQKLWMLYMTGEAFLCAYDFFMINCLLNSHDCCIFFFDGRRLLYFQCREEILGCCCWKGNANGWVLVSRKWRGRNIKMTLFLDEMLVHLVWNRMPTRELEFYVDFCNLIKTLKYVRQNVHSMPTCRLVRVCLNNLIALIEQWIVRSLSCSAVLVSLMVDDDNGKWNCPSVRPSWWELVT